MIAMALEAAGRNFCKVTFNENGKKWTRRVHMLNVQDAEGKTHVLTGKRLPDSIDVSTGTPYAGAHLCEVLLSPKKAKAIPLRAEPAWSLSMRDGCFLMLGMIAFGVILSLAEAFVQALV